MADGAFDLEGDVVELAASVPEAPTGRLREVYFRANSWSADEIDTLRGLFVADLPMPDIALAVGRPLHAVRTKVCRLGMRRASKTPWTELEEAELLKRYGDDPTADIAQDLGRTCTAVYQRAAILGLAEAQEPPFTDWEDAQIRAGYASGVPVVQIAALLGRGLSAVVKRAQWELRLRHSNAPPSWSERECGMALELSHQGIGYAEIRARLEAAGFPPRTQQAFRQMMRLVGHGGGWGRLWMEEEDELLRRAYAEGASLTALQHRLGRNKHSFKWRAEVLGLAGTHPNKAGWRTEPAWTEEQDAFVRANYAAMSARAIGKSIGRTRASVATRACVLGVKSSFVTRSFTAEEDLAIEITWRRGISITQLAMALGRDVSATGRRAKKIGFSFSDPAKPKAPRTELSTRPQLTLIDILALERPSPAPRRALPVEREARRTALRPRLLRQVRRELRALS